MSIYNMIYGGSVKTSRIYMKLIPLLFASVVLSAIGLKATAAQQPDNTLDICGLGTCIANTPKTLCEWMAETGLMEKCHELTKMLKHNDSAKQEIPILLTDLENEIDRFLSDYAKLEANLWQTRMRLYQTLQNVWPESIDCKKHAEGNELYQAQTISGYTFSFEQETSLNQQQLLSQSILQDAVLLNHRIQDQDKPALGLFESVVYKRICRSVMDWQLSTAKTMIAIKELRIDLTAWSARLESIATEPAEHPEPDQQHSFATNAERTSLLMRQLADRVSELDRSSQKAGRLLQKYGKRIAEKLGAS